MFRIGAHVSISGGYEKAVDREVELGGNCGQIFGGSPRGWKVSQPGEEESQEFRNRSEEKDVGPWIVHGTYLINFATPKEGLAEKSIKTVQEELEITSKLGIDYYVFHPGAHTGIGEGKGIKNIANRLSKIDIPEDVKLLLENTAGKGTTLGKNFEQLDRMIGLSDHDYSEMGVCLDTVHMFSAGYNISIEAELEKTVEEIEDSIGIDNVKYLHLNDSKHPFGSEKDEHQHIGEGGIGEKGFRLFINHEKLRDKPMVLETPKNGKGFAWNIQKCKELRKED